MVYGTVSQYANFFDTNHIYAAYIYYTYITYMFLFGSILFYIIRVVFG